MIPKTECKDRRLYRIDSRNLNLGVYRAESGGFLGLRLKFGDVFVFEEFHWDEGAPYGTVSPIEELPEELPPDIPCAEFLGSQCLNCKKRVEYMKWPEGGKRSVTLSGGSTVEADGEWHHLEPSDCGKIKPASIYNSKLHEWLEMMGKKYPPKPEPKP
jgi:hypothetical protein